MLFIRRWLALIFIIFGLFLFFYFNLGHYLTFDQLKLHREQLLAWTHQHYFMAVVLYMMTYIVMVSLSIPGGLFLTIAGGFLFGAWGVFYIVVSATLGATFVFFAIRLALEPWISKKNYRWLDKFRQGLQQNAFKYLLILRLLPFFPFWIVNIASALVGVRTSIFITATFIGIIPLSLVYVILGCGLGQLFDQNQMPNLNMIFTPALIIPLLVLAIFPLLVLVEQ